MNPEAPSRSRILIVAPSVVASFTRQDEELLDSAFETTVFSYQGMPSLPQLRCHLRDADCVLIWFAGRHAPPAVWLARRRGLPVVTIVGGYEVAWAADIKYGLPPRSQRAKLVRWVLRNSASVIAVSHVTEAEIAARAPEVVDRVHLINNAINTDRFYPGGGGGRRGVLCVGAITRETISKKGWRLFWETAAAMQDIHFTAVGRAFDGPARKLVADCPANLTWLGALYGDDLLRQFQSAAVYFQGSRHESFGLSVGEAMACGCIPVVSRYAMLPTLVGDTGVLMEGLNPSDAAKAIRHALQFGEADRHAARKRIVENYGVDRRKRLLCAEISRVIAEHCVSPLTRPD